MRLELYCGVGKWVYKKAIRRKAVWKRIVVKSCSTRKEVTSAVISGVRNAFSVFFFQAEDGIRDFCLSRGLIPATGMLCGSNCSCSHG